MATDFTNSSGQQADLDNLVAAHASVCAQIAALLANPAPVVNVGGLSVQWTTHYQALTKIRDDLRRQILEMEDPWEFSVNATP